MLTKFILHLLSGNYWDARENKRRFFDEFAKSNKFNPLVTENWYPITTRMVKKSKVHSINYITFEQKKLILCIHKEWKLCITSLWRISFSCFGRRLS